MGRGLALTLALVCGLPAPASAQAIGALGGPIAEVRFEGDTAGLDLEALRGLLSIRAGDDYEPDRVRDTLATLYQTGRFEGIDVWVTPAGADGVKVSLRLRRAQLLTSWRFSGVTAFRPEVLERVLELTWGQRFEPSHVPRWQRLVQERYAREGYPHAELSVTHSPAGPGRAELLLAVREGSPVRVRRVLVDVSGGLPAGEVRRVLGLEPGERLSREALVGGIERLESRIGSEGWVNGRVRWALVLPDGRREQSHAAAVAAAPGEVDLAVSVQAGRETRIEVEGDVLLPEEDLSRAITIYERRSASPFELDSSAARLRDLYISRGYPDATVTPSIRRGEGERYLVHFQVSAGPRVRVNAVNFEGNATFEAPALRRHLAMRGAGPLAEGSPFDPAVWEEDLAALKAFYVSQGFLRARVVGVRREDVPGKTDAILTVVLDEGPRTVLGRLLFPGLSGYQKAGALQAVGANPGDPYNPGRVPEWVSGLQAYMARLGYPLARVEGRIVEGEHTEDAAFEFKVVPGPRKTVGRIVVRGNLKTLDAVIQRQITVRRGDHYDAEELVKTQQQIYQLGFFDRVAVEPMRPLSDNPDEPIDLVVVLHERETGWVGFGGGYGSLQGPQASAEFLQNNTWGTGRPLRIEGLFSLPRTSLSASLRDPAFLGTDQIGELGFTFLRERRREGEPLYQTLGPTVGLSRPLGEHWLGSLRYAWGQTSYPSLTESQAAAAASLPVRINSVLTGGLTHDSRSDVLNPRWGNKLDLSVDVSTSLLGGSLVYARPRLAGATYVPFPRRVVLALGVEAGYMQPLGGVTGFPTDLLFVTGGASTLRGYFNDVYPPGQPQGGRLMFVSHAEARLPVWGDFGLVAFADAGNVWEDPLTVLRDGLRLTSGLGLRYQTPVGPVRIDYGVRLWPVLQLGNWEGLYVGLGHAF